MLINRPQGDTGMIRTGKIVAAAAPAIVIPLAIVIASLIMSPPRAGNAIAAAKGIRRPLAIAHRGASFDAPELTAASFALARDIGADYVETDVQRTRDGVLVTVHDDDLSRTTDVAAVFPGREKDPVSSFTWSEVSRLDAGSWFNRSNPGRARKNFAGQRIPSFDEYLALLSSGHNRPGLLIELKNPARYPGIESQVLSALRARGWIDGNNRIRASEKKKMAEPGGIPAGLGRHRVILQSFDEGSLARLAKAAPGIMRVRLVNEGDLKRYGSISALLERERDCGAEIGLSGYIAYPWNIGTAHRRGRLVFVYTIDRPLHFMIFSFFGVDGMITNRCGAYLEFLGRPINSPTQP